MSSAVCGPRSISNAQQMPPLREIHCSAEYMISINNTPTDPMMVFHSARLKERTGYDDYAEKLRKYAATHASSDIRQQLNKATDEYANQCRDEWFPNDEPAVDSRDEW